MRLATKVDGMSVGGRRCRRCQDHGQRTLQKHWSKGAKEQRRRGYSSSRDVVRVSVSPMLGKIVVVPRSAHRSDCAPCAPAQLRPPDRRRGSRWRKEQHTSYVGDRQGVLVHLILQRLTCERKYTDYGGCEWQAAAPSSPLRNVLCGGAGGIIRRGEVALVECADLVGREGADDRV